MRKSWDQYFLDLCDVVATRSTCPRRHVGCVITKNNRIVATGYNGSKPGEPHCEDKGCNVVNNHCTRTIHAEENALNQVDKGLTNTTLYCIYHPCYECAKKILSHNTFQHKITRIAYREPYWNDTLYLASEFMAVEHISQAYLST